MEFEEINLQLKIDMESSIENLEKNLSKIFLGAANPALFSTLQVDYYGSPSEINTICSITFSGSQQLILKPYDQSIMKEIKDCIERQRFNVTVQDEGDKLRISFPTLTTEKRKETVKQLSVFKESSKISIRNARQQALKSLKKIENISEDDEKRYEQSIQKNTNEFNAKIEKLVQAKEAELLKI